MTNAKLYFLSALASLALFVLPAVAAAQACQPECSISITLPPGNAMPVVDHTVVKADPGATIEFNLADPGNVWVFFTNPGKTPFVDQQGDPVYSFNVNQLNGQRLRVRKIEDGEANPCPVKLNSQGKEYSACKYSVVESGNHRRPPLDPFIILN